MIASITGTIHAVSTDSLIILTSGGVGYQVGVSKMFATKHKTGGKISLYTYLKVSDSALDLYGFQTVEERQFFTLLLSVSGVGPKSAMNILSLGSIDDIKNAISRSDATYLSAVQGIGKKTAERMVVELKSKLGNIGGGLLGGPVGESLGEVIDGLVAMGYTKEEAKEVVKHLNPKGKTTEQLLREALQMRGK